MLYMDDNQERFPSQGDSVLSYNIWGGKRSQMFSGMTALDTNRFLNPYVSRDGNVTTTNAAVFLCFNVLQITEASVAFATG